MPPICCCGLSSKTQATGIKTHFLQEVQIQDHLNLADPTFDWEILAPSPEYCQPESPSEAVYSAYRTLADDATMLAILLRPEQHLSYCAAWTDDEITEALVLLSDSLREESKLIGWASNDTFRLSYESISLAKGPNSGSVPVFPKSIDIYYNVSLACLQHMAHKSHSNAEYGDPKSRRSNKVFL